MENTQSLNPVWCLVDFKFLIADEQMAAAKRHGFVRGLLN